MRIDQRRIPYMKPLYWKWIWSTMRKPGCKNMDADTIRCDDGSTDPRMKLCTEDVSQQWYVGSLHSPEQCNSQYQFCHNNCGPLICNDRPSIVIEVVHVNDFWVDKKSRYWQEFLEVSKKRRVIQRCAYKFSSGEKIEYVFTHSTQKSSTTIVKMVCTYNLFKHVRRSTILRSARYVW